MKLTRLYRIDEAGVMNSPTAEPKKKKKSAFRHANGGAMSFDDDDDDEDELGPDMDYEDPSPEAPEHDGDAEPEPDDEPEKEAPFASKPAKPSPALQGGKTAGSVKADGATLGALQKALESVRTSDDDLQDWIDDVVREISRAMKSDGELTLPKFEATPSLDSFDDDDGGYEDED